VSQAGPGGDFSPPPRARETLLAGRRLEAAFCPRFGIPQSESRQGAAEGHPG
jgi:hypothetical protein